MMDLYMMNQQTTHFNGKLYKMKFIKIYVFKTNLKQAIPMLAPSCVLKLEKKKQNIFIFGLLKYFIFCVGLV